MIAKAKMTTADFKKAASAMDEIVERRNTIPILGEVLVSIEQDKVTFCATNLDQQLTLIFEAETEGTAQFTIAANRLKGFASAAIDFVQINMTRPPENSLHKNNIIELETRDMVLRNLERHDISDFPKTKTINDAWHKTAKSLTASQDQLKRAFKLGRHCISTEETRYYLNGSFITCKPDGKTMRVVTTDGHRLGVIDTDILMPDASQIIHASTVDQILKLMTTGGNEPIEIKMNDAWIVISKKDAELVSKVIDGKYPDYTRVIPKWSDNITVQVSGVAMTRLANASKGLTEGLSTTCEFNIPEGKAIIRSRWGDTVSVPMTGTGNQKIGANIKYLQDQCRATPNFTMKTSGSGEPMRCTGDDPDALFVIMPMRISG